MKKISRNFISLFLSDGVTRLIGFAATVYMARILAVEGFGLINYGLAFISYALLFANPGLTVIGAREVAKAPQDRNFIEETVGLRLVLAIVIFGVFYVGTRMMPGESMTKHVVLAYALTLFPFAVLMEFVFQGREEMGYIGIGRVLQYALYFSILLFFLKKAADILVVPIAFVLGYVFVAFFLIVLYIRKYRVFKFRFSPSKWRMILASSFPVGLAIIFNQVTISLAPIVLGIFRTHYDVGIFSAGYKIVFMLLVIERVSYYVFFPILTKQHKSEPEKLPRSFNFLTRFLFALTIPIALGGLILAPHIIGLVYGAGFAESINVLRILLIYFMIVPINTIFGYGLIAIDQEKRFFKIITITAIISAVLIVVLGIRFGVYGAAVALCISELTSIILMSRQLGRFVRYGRSAYILKPFIAAVPMVIALYILRAWHVVFLVGLGIVFYLFLFFLLKGFSMSDLHNLKAVVLGDGNTE